MSETTAAIETATLGLNTLEEYEPLVGATTTQRILEKLAGFARYMPSISARHSMAAGSRRSSHR